MKIEMWCDFCSAKTEVEVETDWGARYGSIMKDDGTFCPKHKKVEQFLEKQCPGCVSGWGECGLYKILGNEELSENDKAVIRTGRCPHRVNGSFMVSNGVIEEADLSEIADEGGEAIIQAFVDCKEWLDND